MNTPFDLIARLSAWFLRADRDVALPSGRRIVITGANVEISSGNLVITGGNITVSGTVDGVDIAAHVADADAHHNEVHAHTHASLTSVSANQHHNQVHSISGSDHTGTLTDGQIPSTIARDSEVTSAISTHASDADAHHNESHALSSHTGTLDHGSALTGLSDDDHPQYHNNTRGDARYYQKSEFSGNPGAASAPIKSDTNGAIHAEYLLSNDDARIAGGITSGSNTIGAATGTLLLKEVSTPGTPTTGFGYLYVSTSGTLKFKNDSGTDYTVVLA